MNTLLVFFAFPIATIILSAVLERYIQSPITVAAIFFAIFLVITFAFFDVNFLIATIIYTILSFLIALAVRLVKRWRDENESGSNTGHSNNIVTDTTATAQNTVISITRPDNKNYRTCPFRRR